MVDGLPKDYTNGYIFTKNMTPEQVIKAAKDAGADEKTLNNLRKVIESDTDGKVSNAVEAEMLQSVFDPKYKMKNVTAENGTKINYVVPIENSVFSKYGNYDKEDVIHFSEHYNDSQECFKNLSYLIDTDSNTAYELYDLTGDGEPNEYKEISIGNGFPVKRRVFPNMYR